MFIPNPNFLGFVSPFQANLLNSYFAEYYLELRRKMHYDLYPSRLNALFLFENEIDANEYKIANPLHVANRVLRKVKSKGNYVFSKHDSSWIDFLRLKHYRDNETIDNVCKSYWDGNTVEESNLLSLGKPWSKNPLFEILYIGLVKFDKSHKAIESDWEIFIAHLDFLDRKSLLALINQELNNAEMHTISIPGYSALDKYTRDYSTISTTGYLPTTHSLFSRIQIKFRTLEMDYEIAFLGNKLHVGKDDLRTFRDYVANQYI